MFKFCRKRSALYTGLVHNRDEKHRQILGRRGDRSKNNIKTGLEQLGSEDVHRLSLAALLGSLKYGDKPQNAENFWSV